MEEINIQEQVKKELDQLNFNSYKEQNDDEKNKMINIKRTYLNFFKDIKNNSNINLENENNEEEDDIGLSEKKIIQIIYQYITLKIL